jgi:hypothetical protein
MTLARFADIIRSSNLHSPEVVISVAAVIAAAMAIFLVGRSISRRESALRQSRTRRFRDVV